MVYIYYIYIYKDEYRGSIIREEHIKVDDFLSALINYGNSAKKLAHTIQIADYNKENSGPICIKKREENLAFRGRKELLSWKNLEQMLIHGAPEETAIQMFINPNSNFSNIVRIVHHNLRGIYSQMVHTIYTIYI